MRQKLIIVSHCILNTASKVVMYDEEEMQAEEYLRKQFLKKAIDKDIRIIQLPCPEFTLYGPKRWGHVKEQFDNVFFRKHCREILIPVMDQIREYCNHTGHYEVLGVLGVDGSPSCGADYTCTGKHWYGSVAGRDDRIMDIVHEVDVCKSEGVFIQVLRELMEEYGLTDIQVTGLFAPEPDKCMNLLGD